jgi:hypothetical protein
MPTLAFLHTLAVCINDHTFRFSLACHAEPRRARMLLVPSLLRCFTVVVSLQCTIAHSDESACV